MARLLHGICVGSALVINPVYLLEIANDEIRGVLGSSVLLVGHLGLVFAFGNFCSFQTAPIFMLAVTVLFIVLFSFFPETPTFLIKHNKISVCCMECEHMNHLPKIDNCSF